MELGTIAPGRMGVHADRALPPVPQQSGVEHEQNR